MVYSIVSKPVSLSLLFKTLTLGLVRTTLDASLISIDSNDSLSNVKKSAARAAAIKLISVVFPVPFSPIKNVTCGSSGVENEYRPQNPVTEIEST